MASAEHPRVSVRIRQPSWVGLGGRYSGSLGTLDYTDFDFQVDINSSKIAYEENLAYLFSKILSEHVFEKHVNCMGLRSVSSLL